VVQSAADRDYLLEFAGLYQVNASFALSDDQSGRFLNFSRSANRAVIQSVVLEKSPSSANPRFTAR